MHGGVGRGLGAMIPVELLCSRLITAWDQSRLGDMKMRPLMVQFTCGHLYWRAFVLQ